MSNQFSPEDDDRMPEKKSSQQLLLLILLLLIVIFAYLYFFTGVIRSRGNESPPPAPVAEVMVKKPLPPRPSQKAVGAKPDFKQGAAAKAATGATSAKEAKPSPIAASGKGTPAAKNGASAAEVKTAKSAAGAAGAQQTKPAKPGGGAKEGKPATAAGKKPAVEGKGVQKATAAGAGAAKQAKAKAGSGSAVYTLELSSDLLESEMGPVTAKLKGAGLVHLVKTRVNKGEPMLRLFLADFGNHDEAQEELDRLKVVARDAFMLKEDGRYAVYAGSYLRRGKATIEQDRLLARGVKLLIKNATAPVLVVKVRAGSFADRASAEKASRSLKKGGLSAKVVKVAN